MLRGDSGSQGSMTILPIFTMKWTDLEPQASGLKCLEVMNLDSMLVS